MSDAPSECLLDNSFLAQAPSQLAEHLVAVLSANEWSLEECHVNLPSVSRTNASGIVSRLLIRSGRNPHLPFAVIGDAAMALASEETREGVELSLDAAVFALPLDTVFEETYGDVDLSPDVFSRLWWCPWQRLRFCFLRVPSTDVVSASPHAEAAKPEEAQCFFLFRGLSKFAELSALKVGILPHPRLKSVED